MIAVAEADVVIVTDVEIGHVDERVMLKQAAWECRARDLRCWTSV